MTDKIHPKDTDTKILIDKNPNHSESSFDEKNAMTKSKFETIRKSFITKLRIIKTVKEGSDPQNFTMKDNIEKFKEMGEGVFFYFYFIKFFAIVFFIIASLSITSIVINCLGGGMAFHADVNFLLSTTLGNTSKTYFDDDHITNLKKMTPKERHKFVLDSNKHVHDDFLIHMIIDILISLVLFLSIYIF